MPLLPPVIRTVLPESLRSMAFSPIQMLGDQQIVELPAFECGVEVPEAVIEGDGPRRLGLILVPSAEFGDDPCGPCHGSRRIGISLACGLALYFAIEPFDESDLVGGESGIGGLKAFAVAGVDEHHDDGGSLGGDGDHLAEAVGLGDLAVLDAQALALEGAEELLDGPPAAIPIDDAA